ncbi:metallophosphoesterase family protein [Maricaulis sp.]|uniref:metallophosphoesterase family protein n=1 Tax=Maricaulis sp. TaxID=1486257 RepID=UPI003A93C422
MTRLVQISDIHFGAEDPALVNPLTDAINTIAPDLVVVTGDVTQYGRRREFNAARAFLDALEPPIVGAPGNHDTPYFDLFARLASPWARFERQLGPRLQPRAAASGVQVEMLPTARGAQARLDWSLGRVREADALEAGEALSGFDGLKVLGGHHPLVAPGGLQGRAKTTGGAQAAQLIVQAGIDLYLSGHLHQVFTEPVERSDGSVCWFVGAGTALSRRTRGEPASFNVIQAGTAPQLTVWSAGDTPVFAPGEVIMLDGLGASGGR